MKFRRARRRRQVHTRYRGASNRTGRKRKTLKGKSPYAYDVQVVYPDLQADLEATVEVVTFGEVHLDLRMSAAPEVVVYRTTKHDTDWTADL